jgi:colanic acid/amylovoran biosynthesis glycosyltransferase
MGGVDDRWSRPVVLVLTTTLPAREGDGTPEFVLSLAQALSKDFDIHIVAPRTRGARRFERLDGVTIHRFRYAPSRWEGLADAAIMPTIRTEPWRVVQIPFLLAGLWFAAFKVAYRAKPSVIHAHWLIPSGLVALSIRWLLGTPYIVTVHGGDAYMLTSGPMRLLKRTVIRSAHLVAPVSRDMGKPIGLPDQEMERLVVPFGVDIEAIKRDVGHWTPNLGKFLFVGRLADKKGVEVLLRALARIPEGSLVVVGDGPEAPKLKALAGTLGIDQRVRFIGTQPRARVMQELRTAHALVIPSVVGQGGDRDGTPVVMSEAMAAGVPVIASRLGGLAEHIASGETGLLFDPGSESALADALRRALTSIDELGNWAVRARERMRGVLDIESTRDRYSAFLLSARRESVRRGGPWRPRRNRP